MKFHNYGAHVSRFSLQTIIATAQLQSWLHSVHEEIKQIIHIEDGRLGMQFIAQEGMRITWGQWRLVVDCLVEFEERWETVDMLFDVAETGDGRGWRVWGRGAVLGRRM